MFEDWKKAWQQAVENFQHEIADEEKAPAPSQLAAMRRDLAAARSALDQLNTQLLQTQTELAEEEKQEEVCRRRAQMARAIEDETTVAIALQWAERHKQRGDILRKKSEVLSAELTMRTEDLDGMQAQLNEKQSELAAAGPTVTKPRSLFTDQERAQTDADFRRLERERAAQERLDELKKKMK